MSFVKISVGPRTLIYVFTDPISHSGEVPVFIVLLDRRTIHPWYKNIFESSVKELKSYQENTGGEQNRIWNWD